MRVRKVVTRSGRGFRGYFPSKKLNRMVHWESLLERDAILLFEFSSAVAKYQEQPELIHYVDVTETRQYYPDFEVVLNNGEIIHVEIKPSKQIAIPKIFNKLSALAHHYKTRQMEYKVLTEKVIRREPLHSNLKLLAKSMQQTKQLSDGFNRIQEILSSEVHTVTTLARKVEMSSILQLIAIGELSCNLEIDLMAPDNFLRLNKGGDHDSILL